MCGVNVGHVGQRGGLVLDLVQDIRAINVKAMKARHTGVGLASLMRMSHHDRAPSLPCSPPPLPRFLLASARPGVGYCEGELPALPARIQVRATDTCIAALAPASGDSMSAQGERARGSRAVEGLGRAPLVRL